MFNNESYRIVLDNLSDGVYVLSPQRKIMYWNKGAERISGFTAEEVLGKSCCDNILTHTTCDGQCMCKGICPAGQTAADGQTRQAQLYLHHKDGYRVPVQVTVAPIKDEAGQTTGVIEIFREDSARQGCKAVIETLKRQMMNDLTTGLPNRKFTEARLASRLEETRRFGWPFAVLIAEVDEYKQVLAEHGKDFTDRVLKMVAGSVANATRATDAVGRWDENQFLAIIANASTDQVQLVAERARMLVETSYLATPEGTFRATVSIGASAIERGDSIASLLRRAELCLYHSRTAGRNRVTVHQPAT